MLHEIWYFVSPILIVLLNTNCKPRSRMNFMPKSNSPSMNRYRMLFHPNLHTTYKHAPENLVKYGTHFPPFFQPLHDRVVCHLLFQVGLEPMRWTPHAPTQTHKVCGWYSVNCFSIKHLNLSSVWLGEDQILNVMKTHV